MEYKDSWLVSDNYLIKITDKSVFFSKSTGMPKEIVLEWLQQKNIFSNGKECSINLKLHNRQFETRIVLNKAGRVVMHFSKAFIDHLRSVSRFAYTLKDLKDPLFKNLDYPLVKFIFDGKDFVVDICESCSTQNKKLRSKEDCEIEDINIFVYQDIHKTLVKKDPPCFSKIRRRPPGGGKSRTPKKIDYLKKQETSMKTGLEGELRVIDYLKEEILSLEDVMFSEVDKFITHSSLKDDSLGYDIVIHGSDGSVKYIEVKTTKSSALAPFYITPNELKFSECNAENYYLYRLYNFQYSSKEVDYYVIQGNLKNQLELLPIQYEAYPNT